MMPAYGRDDRAEFGVLFVSGIAHQRPGSAVAALSAALYGWLFRWNCRTTVCPKSSPALSHAVLSPGAGPDDGPARLSLAVSLPLSSGRQDARWLIAESSWPSLFDAPRFLDLARWIWKVSTCLLVLQFVIPVRRNIYQARSNPDGLAMPGRLAHAAAALCCALLMCAAAMLSILLSIFLFALAVAAKLPIPRIELAVRWVVVKISSVLGDSYVLAHCPVQFAAMRTKVARDLRWLQERCGKVAIVAHSQGAAIAHQVLKDGDYHTEDDCPSGTLRSFITLGQGIAKMHLLQRMDWDPRVHRAAWWSRLLVTTGMACAGFPAFAVLASRRIRWPVLLVPAAAPWSIVLIISGLAVIAAGVIFATRAVRTEVEQDVRLPAACSQFSWIDYYAGADPVSNGPLMTQPAVNCECGTEPAPCNEITNFQSLLADHNGYLRNQDELLSRLLNDLVAAACGDRRTGSPPPMLVSAGALTAASQSRRRRTAWLVGARVVTAVLGVAQFFYLPTRSLDDPVNQLVRMIIPHVRMGDDLVRLTVVLIFMALVYAAVLILWRIADRRAMTRFLGTTPHSGTPADQLPQTPEPASQATDDQVPAALS
jgi:hypothetical protein